jgi:hypothetical protein
MEADAAAPDLGLHPRSRFMFVVDALGVNGLLLPLVALAAMVVIALMIWKGKGPAMVGAVLLVVPAPICWSLLGAVSGLLSSFGVLATADVQLKSSEIFGGMAEVLVNVQTGAVLTIPLFLSAVGGLIFRALTDVAPTILSSK